MTWAARDYLRDLSDALMGTLATDRSGRGVSLEDGLQRGVRLVTATRAVSDRKVMLVGNGGSAAIVAHLHCDLSKTAGVRSVVFHEPPLLTALTNDHGYEDAFARQVDLWAGPDDLLIAVSSSGESENILRAARAAIGRGCRVLSFTGFRHRNPLRRLGEVNFYVPSDHYGHVEAAHMALGHMVADRASAMFQATVNHEPVAAVRNA